MRVRGSFVAPRCTFPSNFAFTFSSAEWDMISLDVGWGISGDDPPGFELVLLDSDENQEVFTLDGEQREFVSENSAYGSGGAYHIYPLNSCGERMGLVASGGF